MENMKRLINPFKKWHGSFIPEWLLSRSEISAGAKLCYARLLRFAGSDGYCNPKLETIAEKLGVSKRQVSKYLNELKKVELIGTERIGLGKSNRYLFYEHEWSDCFYEASDSTTPNMNDSSTQDMNDSSTQEGNDSSTPNMNDSSTPIYNDLRESVKESQTKRVSLREGAPASKQGDLLPDARIQKAKKVPVPWQEVAHYMKIVYMKRQGVKPPQEHMALIANEAQKFCNHYDSNGWKVGGRTKMKDWQAAVRNWLSRMSEYRQQQKPQQQTEGLNDDEIEQIITRDW